MLKIILSSLLIFASIFTIGQTHTNYPLRPNSFVYDELQILTEQQKSTLDSTLHSFEKRTSNEIVVVIVSNLGEESAAMYATNLGQKWGIGKKGKDNGIVMLIKPNGEKGSRETFIAVGYGLEGIIPDAIAKRIIEKELIPKFKNNNMYGGIVSGIQVLMKLSEKEFSATEYENEGKGNSNIFIIIVVIVLLIIIGIRIPFALKFSKENNSSFIIALLLANSLRKTEHLKQENPSLFNRNSSSSSSSNNSSRKNSRSSQRSKSGGGSFGGGGAGAKW